jgi:hypothetical protein
MMDMREILFSETEDGCAACGLKRGEWLTIHHIDGNRSNNTYDNQIVLCHNCHCAHHQGKGLTAEEIRDLKRRLIRKTLTQFEVNALKIAKRNGKGVMGTPFLLHHMVGLGFLKEEETSQTYDQIPVAVRFTITAAGAELLKTWEL